MNRRFIPWVQLLGALFLVSHSAAALVPAQAQEKAPPAPSQLKPAPPRAIPVVREQIQVRVGGIEETWRLVWEEPPQPACGPEDPGWSSCACFGWAYGERGFLRLVRFREGKEYEWLPLGQFFAPMNTIVQDGGFALPRWPVEAGDHEDQKRPGFAERVKQRPVVQVMKLGDFDHDGRATEFFLQTSSGSCPKTFGIVVGVSFENDRLHVFHSVEDPGNPLLLGADDWQKLLGAAEPMKRLERSCKQNGNQYESESLLFSQAGKISVQRLLFRCTPDGQRGELIKKN